MKNEGEKHILASAIGSQGKNQLWSQSMVLEEIML